MISESLSVFGFTDAFTSTGIALRGFISDDEGALADMSNRYYNVMRVLNPLDKKLYSGTNCNYHKDTYIKADYFDNIDDAIQDENAEFYPWSCTENGYLSSWEELTASNRYYINDTYSDDDKREIIQSILCARGMINREGIENIFKTFSYTIVYDPDDDNPDNDTIRIEESSTFAFRTDFGRCDIDTIQDSDESANIHIYSPEYQDDTLLSILDTLKCVGTSYQWHQLYIHHCYNQIDIVFSDYEYLLNRYDDGDTIKVSMSSQNAKIFRSPGTFAQYGIDGIVNPAYTYSGSYTDLNLYSIYYTGLTNAEYFACIDSDIVGIITALSGYYLDLGKIYLTPPGLVIPY